MYNVLDQKLFDTYIELKCEPIIAIIEPNMYMGKFDWAKCVRPTGARQEATTTHLSCRGVRGYHCVYAKWNAKDTFSKRFNDAEFDTDIESVGKVVS